MLQNLLGLLGRAQWICQLGESNSQPPTERLSEVSFQLCFPHPTPTQFSFPVPLLFLPTPRALISLPSLVSSSRLLAVILLPHTAFCQRCIQACPKIWGTRTWQLHLDPPRLGVYHSLRTPCPGMTQAAHYLPGLPGRQGIIYLCSELASLETQFHTRISGGFRSWHILVVVAAAIQPGLFLPTGKAKCCSLGFPSPLCIVLFLSHHHTHLCSAGQVLLWTFSW